MHKKVAHHLLTLSALLIGSSAVPNVPSVHAATGSGDCIISTISADLPQFATIQQGLDDANCLRLDIRQGIYAENLVIRRDVALVGAGQQRTIIDGQQLGRVIVIKQGTTVLIKGVTVKNGRIADIGGGIYTEYGTDVEIDDTAVLSNTAALGGERNLGFGGGIYNSSDMTIANSVIAWNVAEGWGGGIDHYGPSLLIVNTTIAENRSGSLGGGVLSNGYPGGQYDLRIENSTIARNLGTSGLSYYSLGGIPDAVRIVNSIIADNGGNQCAGNVLMSGTNVVSDSSCGNVNGQNAGLSANGLKPMNGSWAIALTTASPAMDAISLPGACPVRDQFGVLRPQDGNSDGSAWCDAGALETTTSNQGGTPEPTGTPIPGGTATPGPTMTPAPAIDCTISINRGQNFTNQLVVNLTINASGATKALVSNDGGFASASLLTYTREVSWTLTDPGKRLATLLVYARAESSSGPLCGNASLIDDIIYDPVPPALEIKPIKTVTQTNSGTITVTLNADDQEAGSGIAQIQVSKKSNFAGATWQRFTSQVQIAAQRGEQIFVRVSDNAGNISRTAFTVVGSPERLFLPMLAR
jgi:hypothetical protein